MTDEQGRAIVAVLGITTALCLLSCTLAITTEAIRNARSGDGLQPYRLVSLALFLGATFLYGWRATIWLDQVLWAGALLGPTPGRWRLDLMVGLVGQALLGYAAWIYWRDRWRVWRYRRARKSKVA